MQLLYYLQQPWPWYVSGLSIAGIMLILAWQGKPFGFSSNLRTICSIAGAGKVASFFSFDRKSQYWNLLFLAGTIAGGFISQQWLSSGKPLQLSADTIHDLQQLHITFNGQMLPAQLGWTVLLTGGFLVGLGSRYAGGCTSGHAISGLSNLQWPSLIAVTGFFTGGLLMTHLIFPLIF
ncbi:YeeE/YedE family protein [Chitinophaga tropicalis]|uniref:YeeE/YedE family protein n=1 Tax=Chitinophaga tropicalis TaxID=2683588 RepID=A0A7K1U4U1_9BACT|nr:YeeE/YedE thiosulfate transporter family protein [Chitinophaga tropicalis]MVT09378.1 YeeE/YedE family protein [Chitinophaga tropicalis]